MYQDVSHHPRKLMGSDILLPTSTKTTSIIVTIRTKPFLSQFRSALSKHKRKYGQPSTDSHRHESETKTVQYLDHTDSGAA